MFRKRARTTLSRAEMVRQRRQTKQATAVKPSRTHKRRSTSAAPPPASVVVSRYGMGQAVASASAPRPRVAGARRLRVSRRGYTEVVASVPLPALGWRWLSLTLASLTLFLLAALWFAPFFRVDVPQVQGVRYLPAGEVAVALPVRNRPVVALNPARLAADLQASFPAMAQVKVRVGFPNRVTVVVQERQPVLAWRAASRTWWIDAHGLAFTPPVAKTPAGLRVVQADVFPQAATKVRTGLWQVLSPQQVQSLQALSRAVPQGTPLVFSARYGLGWQAPEGWQVFVGREMTRLPQRLALYQAIAQWLRKEGIRPAMIDLASLRTPYYRLKMEP